MNTTEEILALLRSKVRLETGLSERELSRAEEIYDFRFPPDLRALLGAALPSSLSEDKDNSRFPNWRDVPNDYIQMRMEWGLDGVLFDVEMNDFWVESWNERPVDLGAALQIARREFAAVPKLIPVYGHRFLPCEPCKSGNPVFSVHQTDVIYYGSDLLEYFQNEFSDNYQLKGFGTTIHRIPFWSFLAESE